MYNDMYCTYDNASFQFSYPYSFFLQNKDYLYNQYTPNVAWVYGNSVSITFNLAVMNDLPSFEDKSLKLIVYNYRMEIIYEFDMIAATLQPTFLIDVNTSKDVFKTGVYFCELQLLSFDDTNEEQKQEITSLTTLIPPSSYICYVYM